MGCGKSAAAQAFAELGAEVLDADKLAHAALENNPEVVAAVKRAVGERAYGADGKPNRAEIAKAVFSDAAKLAKIERANTPRNRKGMAGGGGKTTRRENRGGGSAATFREKT